MFFIYCTDMVKPSTKRPPSSGTQFEYWSECRSGLKTSSEIRMLFVYFGVGPIVSIRQHSEYVKSNGSIGMEFDS